MMLKLFNGLNGIFYLAWGVWGVFSPHESAKLMGWDVNTLLGMHEMRATWAAFAMLGLAIMFASLGKNQQRGTAFAIVMGTSGLFIGRSLALILDGAGPSRTYMELAVEAFIIVLGLFLLRRAQTISAD